MANVLVTGLLIVILICASMFAIGIGLPTQEPMKSSNEDNLTTIICPNPSCNYHSDTMPSDFLMTYSPNDGVIIYYCQNCRTQWEVKR